MESIGSGTLLRPSPVGIRRASGDVGLHPARIRPMRVRIGNGFQDEGHFRYYASSTPARCGPKKEEKKRMKLVKGFERDLNALYSMGFGAGKSEGAGEVKGQKISEAAELLLAEMTKLKAEAKEMKRRRKQEKAAMKAAKAKDRAEDSSSSSSESSDSECEKTVVKMSSLRTASQSPVTAAALQTENVIEEAMKNLSLDSNCCSSTSIAEIPVKAAESKIEVCMGGKCKRSGAMELMAEFDKKVGVEGAVVGCKCMGKCRDGPNVRVVNQRAEDEMARAAKGPLCIGVGLEDVGSIVANFFEGKNKNVGFVAV